MNNLKSIITLGALALLTQIQAVAQSISGEFTSLYTSAYTFRGAKVSGTAIQPSISLSLGNLSLGVWHTQPTAKSEKDNNEVDFSVGYTTEGLTKFVDLEAGAIAYHYPKADSNKTTYEQYVGLVKSFINDSLSLGVRTYYDNTLKAYSHEGNFSYSFSPKKDGPVSLTPRAAVGVVDSRIKEVKNYTYWTGGVDLGYSFVSDGKNSVGVSVGVSYTSSDIKVIKRDIWAYSVGVSASF